jgi:phosphatidylinositol-3-phosphatase
METGRQMKKITFIHILVLLVLSACQVFPPPGPALPPTLTLPSATPSPAAPTPTAVPLPTLAPFNPATATPQPSPTPTGPVPAFKHIIFILFENKEFSTVIGNRQMPYYNQLASQYTLLTQHYAIRHPSLPNYVALIGGDTFNYDTDTPKVYIHAPSLPDFIEASGRTWKTYQESMPKPCGLEDTLRYNQKHNPFVFFTSVRDNPERCRDHVVPLTNLETDLKQGTLPNYAFIMPNLCDSAHDAATDPDHCGLGVMDQWLKNRMESLLAYPPVAEDGLIVVTWDEGQGDHTCCGLKTGGGRVPTVLVSSKVKKGFQDETPYTHYSLLKTVAEAWTLPALGHAADAETSLITAPWIK